MNTVLFDLDGTMLPMDMKEFTDTYILVLKNRLTSSGFNAEEIIAGIWVGVKAIVSNDGMITNEECFWKAFESFMTKGEGKLDRKERRKIEKELTKFYQEDFGVVRYVTHPNNVVSECIDILKNKGYQIVAATNPIFPEIATMQRIAWAGLNSDDFSLITTYENSCFAKPNLDYYRHILKVLDKDPEDCIMVGNDVHEDMCAKQLGMDVFLIDEYILNSHNEDIFEYKKGNWNVFKEYISNLPTL